MKAKDLHAHMQKVGDWVDWKDTCDRLVAGDPESTSKV